MKHTFHLAVGIAAMDGLLCAFVAVLALAFLLQQETRDASPPSVEEGFAVVELEWRSGLPAEAVNNIVLGIQAHRSMCVPESTLPAQPAWLLVDAASMPDCGITLDWHPCTTSKGTCVAALELDHVRNGASHEYRVYIAGAAEFEKPAAEWIDVAARIYIDANSQPVALPVQKLRFGDVDGVILKLEFSSAGRVSSQWQGPTAN